MYTIPWLVNTALELLITVGFVIIALFTFGLFAVIAGAIDAGLYTIHIIFQISVDIRRIVYELYVFSFFSHHWICMVYNLFDICVVARQSICGGAAVHSLESIFTFGHNFIPRTITHQARYFAISHPSSINPFNQI